MPVDRMRSDAEVFSDILIAERRNVLTGDIRALGPGEYVDFERHRPEASSERS